MYQMSKYFTSQKYLLNIAFPFLLWIDDKLLYKICLSNKLKKFML